MGWKSVFAQVPSSMGGGVCIAQDLERGALLLEFRCNETRGSRDIQSPASIASCSWFWSVSSISQSVIIYSSKQTVRRKGGIRPCLSCTVNKLLYILFFTAIEINQRQDVLFDYRSLPWIQALAWNVDSKPGWALTGSPGQGYTSLPNFMFREDLLVPWNETSPLTLGWPVISILKRQNLFFEFKGMWKKVHLPEWEPDVWASAPKEIWMEGELRKVS